MRSSGSIALAASILLISAMCLPAGGQQGIISTLVGGGTADNIPATSAALWRPWLPFVTADGSIYFSDHLNSRVRKVDPTGTITTVAGTGIRGYSGDGGLATNADLFLPLGVYVTGGTLYICDYSNHRVRQVDPAGIITTIAGTGVAGYLGDGGQATAARIRNPTDVILDGTGNLYIISYNNVIRKVDSAGIITTIAGTNVGGYNGDGIPATTAQLSSPQGMAFDSAGNLYFGDTGNYRVRKIDVTTQIITTVAGKGTFIYSGDGGLATNAGVVPTDVCFDAADNLYITAGHRVRRVDAITGVITTFAGNGGAAGVSHISGDGGPAFDAGFHGPNGVYCDGVGDLYITDTNNNRVRKIDATTQIITTVAGGGAGDSGPASEANVNRPYALAMDGAENIYIADHLYQRIRHHYRR